MYKYVFHVTVYFKKELHRIHRKTCRMDLSIGLRLPVLDINHLTRNTVPGKYSYQDLDDL